MQQIKIKGTDLYLTFEEISKIDTIWKICLEETNAINTELNVKSGKMEENIEEIAFDDDVYLSAIFVYLHKKGELKVCLNEGKIYDIEKYPQIAKYLRNYKICERDIGYVADKMMMKIELEYLNQNETEKNYFEKEFDDDILPNYYKNNDKEYEKYLINLDLKSNYDEKNISDLDEKYYNEDDEIDYCSFYLKELKQK